MTATNTALAITELLEMILLAPGSLTILDLMHCRQVCHEWHSAIDSSLRLRQRMHITPEPASADREPRVIDTLPPHMTCHSFEPHITLDGRPKPDAAEEPSKFSRLHLDISSADIEKLDDSSALTGILLFQPPQQICTCYKLAVHSVEAEGLEDSRVRLPRSRDEIATVGRVVEVAKRYAESRSRRGTFSSRLIRVTVIVRPAREDHEVFGGVADTGVED